MATSIAQHRAVPHDPQIALPIHLPADTAEQRALRRVGHKAVASRRPKPNPLQTDWTAEGFDAPPVQITPKAARPKRADDCKPTGLRRLSARLLQTDRVVENFDGLPAGVGPSQVLAAVKAAAPRLGLPQRLVHGVDWLFKFTQPQDWEKGTRPIVWPSADTQRQELSISSSQARALNRDLIDFGLITMKDSPNGKRWGTRDKPVGGHITEAYGFDLSPLAVRYLEFVRLGEEARAERAEMRRLRRLATIARNGITQLIATAAEYGIEDEDWPALKDEAQRLREGVRQAELTGEAAVGVAGLQRRERTLRELVQNRLAAAAMSLETDDRSLQEPSPESVETTPKGAENRLHQYSYKLPRDPQEDTVVARQDRKADGGDAATAEPVTDREPQKLPEKAAHWRDAAAHANSGGDLGVAPDELVQLAPRLRQYLHRPEPTWPEIVEAANWLRGELGVSQSLWGEACVVMGSRYHAAIAVAIISAKPASHFRTTAGGYFHGMVKKAKAGELNLERTIWALRKERAKRK
jgi:replication initiation protein RepC